VREAAKHHRPIPLAVKIAIVIGGFALATAALFVSMRAWRSSNLFDRQYRFPEIDRVALRLGGTRSGGCMAALDFRSESAPEDA
jgi:hypothetical protein